MPPAIVVVYVGDGQRAMDVGQVLDSRFDRPVHLLRTTPDELETLLRDDRPDCVMAGVALSGDDLQRLVDAVVDARATALPVFDLSGEVAMVPDAVDVHHLYPGTDPTEAADTLIGALLDASLPPAETPDDGPSWASPTVASTPTSRSRMAGRSPTGTPASPTGSAHRRGRPSATRSAPRYPIRARRARGPRAGRSPVQ